MLQRGDLAYSTVLLAFNTYKQHLFFIVCYYSTYNQIILLYKIICILKVYAAFYIMLNCYYILVNRIQYQNTKAGLIFKYSFYCLIICFTFYIIILFFNNWYKVNKDIYGGYLLALNLLRLLMVRYTGQADLLLQCIISWVLLTAISIGTTVAPLGSLPYVSHYQSPLYSSLQTWWFSALQSLFSIYASVSLKG